MSFLSPRYQECILLLHSLHHLLLSIHLFILIIYFTIKFIQNSLFLLFPFNFPQYSFLLIFQLILVLFIFLHYHFQIVTIENLLRFDLHFMHRPHQNIHYQIHHHFKLANQFINPKISFPFTHLNLFLNLKFNQFDINKHFILKMTPP
jgi:hypothetical protein